MHASLIIGAASRLVLFFLVLLTDKSLCFKIASLHVIDFVDCWLPKLTARDFKFCDRAEYQIVDKVIDGLSYIILFFYILFQSSLAFERWEVGLLFGLLAFRLIGTVIFLITVHRKYLFYWPNFFLETCLLIALSKQFDFDWTPFFPCLLLLKILQEFIFHGRARL